MRNFVDKVWNLRAETLQAALPDACIDLVLADPTFGIGTMYAWGREPKDPVSHWRILGPIYRDWLRLLKPTGHIVCFQATGSGAYPRVGTFRYEPFFSEWFGGFERLLLLKWSLCGCRPAWVPDQAIVQTAQRTKPQLAESVILVRYADSTSIGKGVYVPGKLDDYIPHPCFKPYAGVRRIIEMLTRPGDVVLDPFAGSGTTAVAAKLTGRHFIVGDMWPPYCRIALERIAHAGLSMSPYGNREGKGKDKVYFYWHGGRVPAGGNAGDPSCKTHKEIPAKAGHPKEEVGKTVTPSKSPALNSDDLQGNNRSDPIDKAGTKVPAKAKPTRCQCDLKEEVGKKMTRTTPAALDLDDLDKFHPEEIPL